MAKENIVEQIFSPIGQGIRGAARGLFPGAARAADIETRGQEAGIARIQSILQTEEGRRFLIDAQKKMYEARTKSLNRGEGYYGGRRTDPMEQIGNLGLAIERMDRALMFEDNPELKESMINKTKELMAGAEYFQGVGPIDRSLKAAGGRKSLPKAGSDFVGPPAPSAFVGPPAPSAAEYLTDDFVGPPAPLKHDSFEGSLPPNPNEMNNIQSLGDYFQSSTELFPEENIPRTYEQIGISSVDDMSVLDAMQKALPEVDMKVQYENDPINMQRLMNLWRARKVDKKNLHKAFSAIQQRAKETLGIA